MPFYSIDDETFWDEATPDVKKYARVAAQALGPGFDAAAIPLGDAQSGDPPMALILKFGPGGRLERHSHDCYRVEVLLRGELTTPSGEVLKPGTVMISTPGEFYGPHVAGEDGAVTVEVFSRAYADIDYGLSEAAPGTAPQKALRMANEGIAAARLKVTTP